MPILHIAFAHAIQYFPQTLFHLLRQRATASFEWGEMKTISKGTITGAVAMAAVMGLHVQPAQALPAAAQIGEYTQSCSDGRGHYGYINYSTWRGYSPDTSLVWMKSVYNKGTGGGYYRLETYRTGSDHYGSSTATVSLGPDQDRTANNAYQSTHSISQTLYNMAFLYAPNERRHGITKRNIYKFKFLFRSSASGGFTSGCTVTISRTS